MFRLLKYLNKISFLFILLVIGLVILQVYCDLELPDRLTNILNAASVSQGLKNQGLLTEELSQEYRNEILKNSLEMLGFAAVSLVSTILVGFFASRIAASYSYNLRKNLYRHIQNFSMKEIDRFSTASLITRTTNDITQVQMVVIMTLRMAISAPAMAIMGIIKAENIRASQNLSLIVVIAVICLVLLVIGIFLLVMPKFKKMQEYTDRLNLVTRENLTGIRVVRAYGAEEYQENKFNDNNILLTKTNIFANRAMSLLMPGMNLIMHGTSLAILWVGAYWIAENPIYLGSVFGFQQITMMIVMAFMQLIMIFIMIPRGLVSARRINEVFSSLPSITSSPSPQTSCENVKGEVEFQNVGFSYDQSDEEVLQNLSFRVEGGQTLAIIGSTGSGKSTLVHLLMRFFDVTQGKILVDGVDIREYDLHDLRSKIGFIAQKSLLFKGTVRSNLLYGKDTATDEEMIEALKMAQAYDFVMRDPEGLSMAVSQGGSNFSGGQKQRLSIARALVKKPEILVFDDSFSALDFKTDKTLRDNLRKLEGNPTKVIVAQRIGTIMDADLILVLEKGKIVGAGTHEELLKNCQVYQEIAYSQISKEEWDHA